MGGFWQCRFIALPLPLPLLLLFGRTGCFVLIFFYCSVAGQLWGLERHHIALAEFTFKQENIFTRADGVLVLKHTTRLPQPGAVHYNFSAHPLSPPVHFSTQGYLGTAAVFAHGSAPVPVPVPQAWRAAHSTGWGLRFYFFPRSLSTADVLLEQVRIAWRHPAAAPYRERWALELDNGKPVVHLENLFHSDTQEQSLRIISSVMAKLETWNKLELSYNPATGLVTQWLNGQLAGSAAARAAETGQLYAFQFAALPTAPTFMLGTHFDGLIDELSFYPVPLAPQLGQTALAERNAPFTASWSSHVFRLQPFTRIKQLKLIGTNIAPQAVTVVVCASSAYFSALHLPMFETAAAANTQQKISTAASLPQGLQCEAQPLRQDFTMPADTFYYQLFLLIKQRGYPYAEMTALELDTEHDLPPLTPVMTAVKSFPRAILLQFNAGLEDDLAGYTLRYRHERTQQVTELQLPLTTLQAQQQSPHEYTYLLNGLSPGLLYTLELRAYDRIMNGTTRVSRRAARTTIATPIQPEAF